LKITCHILYTLNIYESVEGKNGTNLFEGKKYKKNISLQPFIFMTQINP